jgi:transposase-like protein
MLKKCERGRGTSPRHPPATREAALRAVRVEGLSAADAARSHGVSSASLRRWLAAPTGDAGPMEGPDPEGWSAALRAAAARVHDNPTVAARDWAVLLGWPPTAAGRLARRCGFPARPSAERRPLGWETAELGRRLRRRLAQHIAALDADLADGPAETDAAKVLRDLGGLKRLFDDLRGTEEPDGRAASCDGDAAPDAGDLAALRTTIARRAAAFGADGPA